MMIESDRISSCSLVVVAAAAAGRIVDSNPEESWNGTVRGT